MAHVRIITGDALTELRKLETSSCFSCVTWPPYWQMRDYGVDGQIGLEADVNDWAQTLGEVFDEVRRVICDRGTLWVNVGAFFNAYNGNCGPGSLEKFKTRAARRPKRGAGSGLVDKSRRPKDLVPLPWILGLELQRRGWVLRAEIIWRKTNGMNEPGVKDRPMRKHETVLLFSKRREYYYEGERVDSVWEFPVYEATIHPAAMPIDLALRCVRWSTPEGARVIDPFGGSGTTGHAAEKLGRDATLIELNRTYARAAALRIRDDAPMLAAVEIDGGPPCST